MRVTHRAECSIGRRLGRVGPGCLFQHELAIFEERRCIRLVFISWIPVDGAAQVISDRVRQNEEPRLCSTLSLPEARSPGATVDDPMKGIVVDERSTPRARAKIPVGSRGQG